MTMIKPLDEVVSFFQLPKGAWRIIEEKEPLFDEKEFIIEHVDTKNKYLVTEDFISGDVDYYKKKGYKIKGIVERNPETIEDFERNIPDYKFKYEYYKIFELE